VDAEIERQPTARHGLRGSSLERGSDLRRAIVPAVPDGVNFRNRIRIITGIYERGRVR